MPRPPEYGAGRLQKRPEGQEKDRKMLTHRKRAKAAAAVIAPIIALLMVIAYQGAAAAQGQPPPAPQNPMAHLIAGDGQDPQVRVSWDAPAQRGQRPATRSAGTMGRILRSPAGRPPTRTGPSSPAQHTPTP